MQVPLAEVVVNTIDAALQQPEPFQKEMLRR
jgi:hypothetical protein